MTLKYAVYLPTFTPFGSPRVIAELARDAEQAGWDGFFIWDDVAGHADDMADPWISLSAAAMLTGRVKLGALITPLARRRPWKFARETASLDVLCGGRLVVGAGAGGGTEQFDDVGDEPDQRVRGEMLDEGLQIVDGLWTGEPFQFEGRYYHLKPTTFNPRPLQRPRIPIWIAGVWPNRRPLARMARWDGMFPLFWKVKDPAEQLQAFREVVGRVRALRAEETRPFDIIMSGDTPLGRPAQTGAHIQRFAEAGATWWLEALTPGRRADGAATFEQLRARVLAGPLG